MVGKVGYGMIYDLLCHDMVWYEIETFLPFISGTVKNILLL